MGCGGSDQPRDLGAAVNKIRDRMPREGARRRRAVDAAQKMKRYFEDRGFVYLPASEEEGRSEDKMYLPRGQREITVKDMRENTEDVECSMGMAYWELIKDGDF